MEFFGVSPLELLIIAVLGLIIFGPERLPQIGRTLGRFVARILAWQYTSPEAQMLNELRRDFEKQIVEIRDEMVYARQQLDIRSDLQEIQRETEALIRADPKATPTTGAVATTANDTSATTPATADQQTTSTNTTLATSTTPATSTSAGAGSSVASNGTATSAVSNTATNTAPASDSILHNEIATLTQQISDLRSSLESLQAQLRERGILDVSEQQSETAEAQPKASEPLQVFTPAGVVEPSVQATTVTPEASETVEDAETQPSTTDNAEVSAEPATITSEASELVLAASEAQAESAEPAEAQSETAEASETSETSTEPADRADEQAETNQTTQQDTSPADSEQPLADSAELVEVEASPATVAASEQPRAQSKPNQPDEIV